MKDGEAKANDGAASPDTDETPTTPVTDLTGTLLRLLVGGASEGADAVLRRLVPPETLRARPEPSGEDEPSPVSDEDAAVRARYVLIGLLFEAYGTASRGAAAAGRVAATAGRFWGSILDPLARSPLVRRVRRPYDFVLRRASEELDRWARIGHAEEQRSRELARRLMVAPVEDIVAYLRDNPELEQLVRRQAESLLAELDDDPELASLIRAQGDRYVDHLHEHPEKVQELVRGQSVGLAEDVANSVRERTVTADTLLEAFVRAVLRRRPREELPEPSPEVRAQAERSGTRSDE